MICAYCDEGMDSNLDRWKSLVDDFKDAKFTVCRQIFK